MAINQELYQRYLELEQKRNEFKPIEAEFKAVSNQIKADLELLKTRTRTVAGTKFVLSETTRTLLDSNAIRLNFPEVARDCVKTSVVKTIKTEKQG